jgi:hypothetical protein
MPDIHFDPIYVVILLVLGAGLCIGWVLRAILAPPLVDRREELPFVQVEQPWRTVNDVLDEHRRMTNQAPVSPVAAARTSQAKPAAPTPPKFEEDPFFARPDSDHPDEIERATAAVISMTQRPVANSRAMG